jgi:hypothetical protein
MKNEPHVQNADMMNLLVQCWGQAEVPKYRPRGHESYTSLNGDSPTKLPDIIMPAVQKTIHLLRNNSWKSALQDHVLSRGLSYEV